jgi:hypothetical protein
MIDESAAVLPIWMLLSAILGFIIGETCGDQFRLRKHLQQDNEDLRNQLQNVQPSAEALHRALNQQRSVINDIHKRVVAVTKALQNRSS